MSENTTSLNELHPGDIIYSATTIVNDGSFPGLQENAIIAEKGTRGVIVNVGHLEEDPSRELMLVRFETNDKMLGPEVGCWVEELSASPEQ